MIMVTALLMALATQPPARPASAQSYGLVLVQGHDTIAVERVTNDRGVMRAEVTVPNRARLLVTARTDSLSCVRDADVQAWSWGSARDATPVQQVNVRLDGDSVRVNANARGATQVVARPAPPMLRFVMAEESVATATLLVACARGLRAAGADSIVLPVLAFPNLRMRSLHVKWRGDSVMIAGTDTSWLFLDRAGEASRMVLGRNQLHVQRIPVSQLDAITATMRVATDYTAPAGAPYRAIDVQVRVTPDVVLAGTLTLPSGAPTAVPAVITISGSGGQDRDSYAPIADGWRPFRQIADTLARRGVATLRLDDRGIGGSTGDYATSTERTIAEDMHAAIAFLRARPEIDGRRIVMMGHSEGARVAMLVASQDSLLAAIALLSGAADTRAAMRAQAVWRADHQALGGLSRDSALALVNRQMDSLSNTLPREVLRWNAAELAGRIHTPVGIFQGATDRQVPADQADSLAAIFRRAGNRRITVRILPDRNHLLVRDPDGDFLRYSALPSGRLDPEVLGAIADWVVSTTMGAPAPRP